MTTLLVLRWVHLVAAATWLGGLVVLGPLIFTLRRQQVPRDTLRAVARTFARTTWVAMALAVATGLGQVWVMSWPLDYPRLQVKIAVVVGTILLAGGHQLVAGRVTPAVRGATELGIIAASLVVFAAAVAL